jgi:hypothetical protein
VQISMSTLEFVVVGDPNAVITCKWDVEPVLQECAET